MRFKLHLRPTRNNQKLLFNYQYPIQAWLYRLLSDADKSYADFLHNKGYEVSNSSKKFKHFTFSSLQIHGAKPIKKGDSYIELGQASCILIISFLIDEAAENFIVGLFQNQKMSLYNEAYQADFVVESVETLPLPVFDDTETNKITQTFRTISPMVIAEKVDNIDQYLRPTDVNFARFFALNLYDRFCSIQGKNGLKLDPLAALNIIKFNLLSPPTMIKKRGFTVKEGKVNTETKVIGYYNFSFEITAPSEMIKVGFLGGFGKECAMGCGCVEAINQ